MPKALLAECYVSPSPTAADLIDAPKRYRVVGKMSDWEARFLLMTDYWIMQTDSLALCNKQIGKSREWVNKHRDLEIQHENLGNSE